VAAQGRETIRLKGRQQQIDVMAIFAASNGFIRPSTDGDEAGEAVEVHDMKAELAEERKLLNARAG
jgi:hypothetical protein